jgi:hypothetical protein
MKFKSKVIEGLTYEFMGVLNFHIVYHIDYSGDLPADYQEIMQQEIIENEREQHRLEAKERKDKFDMEKFGRTF